jgi:hypothetical protein
MLEPLRAQKRVNQVSAERGGNDRCNDIFHGNSLLEAVATAHVRPSNQEKQNSDRHEKQIQHILISPL